MNGLLEDDVGPDADFRRRFRGHEKALAVACCAGNEQSFGTAALQSLEQLNLSGVI